MGAEFTTRPQPKGTNWWPGGHRSPAAYYLIACLDFGPGSRHSAIGGSRHPEPVGERSWNNEGWKETTLFIVSKKSSFCLLLFSKVDMHRETIQTDSYYVKVSGWRLSRARSVARRRGRERERERKKWWREWYNRWLSIPLVNESGWSLEDSNWTRSTQYNIPTPFSFPFRIEQVWLIDR